MIKILNNSEKVLDGSLLDRKLEEISKLLQIKGDITIKIGDLKEATELNLTYRNINSPTDVLSFPLHDDLPQEDFYIGDIFICLDLVEKQAEENSLNFYQELLTLIVHGILHLLGHDHTKEDSEMEKLQKNILSQLGYG